MHDNGSTTYFCSFEGTLSLGGTSSSSQSFDAALIHVNQAGAVDWFKLIGGPNSDKASAIDSNSTHVVISIQYSGNILLENGDSHSSNELSGLLIRINMNSGRVDGSAGYWFNDTDPSSNSNIDAIAINPNLGSIMVGGSWSSGTLDFGLAGDFTSTPGSPVWKEGFVATLSRDLQWFWSYPARGPDVKITSMEIDSTNSVTIGGSFSSNLSLRGRTLTSQGGVDGFVASMTTGAQATYLRGIGSSSDDAVTDVATDDQGYSYFVAYFCKGNSGICGAAVGGGSVASGVGNTTHAIIRLQSSGDVDWSSTLESGPSDTGTAQLEPMQLGADSHMILALSVESSVSWISPASRVDWVASMTGDDLAVLIFESSSGDFVEYHRTNGTGDEHLVDLSSGDERDPVLYIDGTGQLNVSSLASIALTAEHVTSLHLSIDDWDHDSVLDDSDSCSSGISSWNATNITDHDGDGCRDADEDLDDDNDGITDLEVGGADACMRGMTGWLSNNVTDLDGDGCRDDDEDLDDDGDGVTDAIDLCPRGNHTWISSKSTDNDGDGCRDSDLEDLDDDNDGLTDSQDLKCQTDVNWTANSTTDLDGDGCRDAGEDKDDDNDEKSDGKDFCDWDSGVTNSDDNWISSKLTDLDGDGCRDAGEDLDDDGDGLSDANDTCDPDSGMPESMTGWTSSLDTDLDQDGCRDSGEDLDDDDDGVLDMDPHNPGSPLDRCPRGDTNWTASPSTDHDQDGCQDAGEDDDDDDDGVADALDVCDPDSGMPDSLIAWNRNETTDADADGCDDAVEDTDWDQDGVINENDDCNGTDIAETPDENGCSLGQLDLDGDGVFDDLDQCPSSAGGGAVDLDGCSELDLDGDLDGVLDRIDICPNTTAGISVSTQTGCALDADGDGVPDTLDSCANTLVTINATKDGCDPVIEKKAESSEEAEMSSQAMLLFGLGGAAVLITITIVYILVFRGEDDYDDEEFEDEEDDEVSPHEGPSQTQFSSPSTGPTPIGPPGPNAPLANSQIQYSGMETPADTGFASPPPSGPSSPPPSGPSSPPQHQQVVQYAPPPLVAPGPPTTLEGVIQPDGWEYVKWPSGSEDWWIRPTKSDSWKRWDDL